VIKSLRLPYVFGIVLKYWAKREGCSESEVIRRALLALWRTHQPICAQWATGGSLPEELLPYAIPAEG
jgi:hypothetical protein